MVLMNELHELRIARSPSSPLGRDAPSNHENEMEHEPPRMMRGSSSTRIWVSAVDQFVAKQYTRPAPFWPAICAAEQALLPPAGALPLLCAEFQKSVGWPVVMLSV